MKLTLKDKELLKSWGYLDEDMDQIQRATTKKTYYELDGERITREEAIEILGREEYLSGISRSAFHYTSVRSSEDGSKSVLFNSHELFR